MALDGVEAISGTKSDCRNIESRSLIDKIEPTTHTVPHGDRSGAIVEPFLTDQWYVDAKTLAAPAIDAVRGRKTVFVPAQWESTFFNWMENIQPWCISRQIWWGHQIPAWYGPDGKIFVAETEDDAVADALAHYTDIEEITAEEGHDIAADPERRTHFANEYLHRDDDVLDTWFSSALWPFSTLGWPDQTPELKRYYPTSVLVTGFDIIFFWVARMMMMGLHFMKEVPFPTVYIHALVRDASGAKMSKSKGNVIDPLEVIDEYGADALRFTLAAMAAQGRDIKLSGQRVEGYRNFATKLWNAARFAEINGCARDPDFSPRMPRRRSTAGSRTRPRRRAATLPPRSRLISSTRRRRRSTALSGISSATGTLSWRSPYSPVRTATPRAKRAPRPRGHSTRSSSCSTRSCLSSRRSFGRSPLNTARNATTCWRSPHGRSTTDWRRPGGS